MGYAFASPGNLLADEVSSFVKDLGTCSDETYRNNELMLTLAEIASTC